MPKLKICSALPVGTESNTALGVTKDAGATLNTTTDRWEMDTSAAHSLNGRALGSPGNPTGYGDLTFVVGMSVRFDSGTVVHGHYLYRDSVANSTHYGYKYSESAGVITIEFVYADVSQGTVIFPVAENHRLLVFCDATVANGNSTPFTVVLDSTVEINVTATNNTGSTIDISNGAGTWGESSGIASSTVVISVWDAFAGFTDRDDPVGHLTKTHWPLSTGVTPPTGYDEGTKSSGTDAAALVDERPPNGTGTTDSDEFTLIDGTGTRLQAVALGNSLLAAGDILMGLQVILWDRGTSQSKVVSSKCGFHDGTTYTPASDEGEDQGSLVSLTGITSYAEHLAGGNEGIFATLAPDGAQLSAKGNTYLDGMFCVVEALGSSDNNASLRVSTVIVEALIEASGDGLDALDDPPVAAAGETVQVLIV